MTDRSQGLILVGLLTALSFAFQIQLKQFANEIAPQVSLGDMALAQRLRGILAAALGWRTAVIFGLGGLLFAVWLLVLTRLDLSVAMPLASIALVVNAVGGGLMTGESLSAQRILGVVIAAIGIGLVLRS